MITYVYLADVNYNGMYKIGVSSNLHARLGQLNRKYRTQYLWLIATECRQQGRYLERTIHNLFADKHLGKELFNLSSVDIETFKTIQPSNLDINFTFIHLSPDQLNDNGRLKQLATYLLESDPLYTAIVSASARTGLSTAQVLRVIIQDWYKRGGKITVTVSTPATLAEVPVTP